ncbi:MAG: pyrroline-5-carboxylate reductase [Ilumatobacteraceae bacterium]
MGAVPVLVIIGGGNMGAALVEGALHAGRSPGEIIVVEAREDRRRELMRMFPGVEVTGAIPACGDVIVAVKPSQVAEVCTAAVARGASRIMSIAAGVRLAALQQASGEAVRVVRAMPNTPALVGMSATAVCVSANCDAADRSWARQLMEGMGIVVELDESLLDAFTGLIGSGPAYVFYLAESLYHAARAEGFDSVTSATLVSQLIAGSAALLQREPDGAERLRLRVTSPNGTTAAGVAQLEMHGVRDAIIKAVRAATARSKELGDA